MTAKRRPGEPNIIFRYDIAGRVYDVNDNGKLTAYYYDRIGEVKFKPFKDRKDMSEKKSKK